MLEGVTLAQMIELVVQVLVDLAAGAVLDEKAAEDAEAAHPKDLRRHTRVSSTFALTVTTVAADSAGKVELAGARTRVHRHGLSDDEAIGDKLANGLAGVGVGDFALLVRVEPDLALSAADNGGREALLSSQVDPERGHSLAYQPNISSLCHLRSARFHQMRCCQSPAIEFRAALSSIE